MGGGNTEALSVKKSAEIAALFADVKLSQTTDITHLMNSPICSDNGIPPSYNPNNKKKQLPPLPLTAPNLNARITSHLEQQRKALMEQQKQNHREIFAQSYHTKSGGSHGGSVSSRHSKRFNDVMPTPASLIMKSEMFSAKNGLYTIQSQSDDSRQSSKKGGPTMDVPQLKSINNIEDSLGYLP